MHVAEPARSARTIPDVFRALAAQHPNRLALRDHRRSVTYREFDLASNLPPISADATQMRQIIMNLVMNASDALGENPGVIRLTTGLLASGRTPRLDVLAEQKSTEPEHPRGRFVSGNYFRVLGVPAMLGRTLDETGGDRFAETASRVAWSPDQPSPDRLERLADEVERELEEE